MAEKKATGKAGAAAPPAAGFAAFFFSTRAWAAAESSRSPTSAVADGGDGALVAVLAFRRHDILPQHRARERALLASVSKRLVVATQSQGGRPATGSRRTTPSYKFTSTKLGGRDSARLEECGSGLGSDWRPGCQRQKLRWAQSVR